MNRLLGQLRGALFRAGDLASCEQIRRARVPILKVCRLCTSHHSCWQHGKFVQCHCQCQSCIRLT